MRSNLLILLLSLGLCVVAINSNGYAYDDGDFQIWHTQVQEKKLNKKTGLSLEEEFRFGDDSNDFYYHHYDAGVSYDLTKNFSLGLNYRHIYEKKSGKFKEENRPHINAIYKWELLGFKVDDRSRLEYRHFDYQVDSWQYRNKANIKLPWKITKLEAQIYLADEIFVNLNEGELTRNRFYSGFGLTLAKNIKIDIYYLLQRSKSSGKWVNANVLGTKFKIAF